MSLGRIARSDVDEETGFATMQSFRVFNCQARLKQIHSDTRIWASGLSQLWPWITYLCREESVTPSDIGFLLYSASISGVHISFWYGQIIPVCFRRIGVMIRFDTLAPGVHNLL